MGKSKSLEEQGELKACVVSFPMPSSVVTNVFLTSLIEILQPTCDPLYVVTANPPEHNTPTPNIRLVDIETSLHFRHLVRPRLWSAVWQLLKIVAIQAKMCWALVRISKRFDTTLFYVGGANLAPAVLMARVLRKRVVIAAIGLGSTSYRRAKGQRRSIAKRSYSALLSVVERVSFSLADLIVVESKGVVDFLGLSNYERKLVPSGARYIDTKLFRTMKGLESRANLVGYVGRLDINKGVGDFADSIVLLSTTSEDISFLIAGDGLLRDRIQQQVESSTIAPRVTFLDWIPHDELPTHLNELKLLVLPSYSEGLPTIILEAMACGTPVLATPVGGIPDVITHGETGFVMQNNSPECIAGNIVRALNHPNLEQIARNARALVEREFTFDKAVERYRKILSSEQ